MNSPDQIENEDVKQVQIQKHTFQVEVKEQDVFQGKHIIKHSACMIFLGNQIGFSRVSVKEGWTFVWELFS